ncbi:hypothetical protein HRbin36_01472 [bacterium HR36]|nr:hypothetical protein HRbin36_01472 [bacterium HR36]
MLLVAIIVPAVVQAQEAYKRAKCAAQLSQIALAFQMHHHDLRILPSGGGVCCRGRSYMLNGQVVNNPPTGGVVPVAAHLPWLPIKSGAGLTKSCPIWSTPPYTAWPRMIKFGSPMFPFISARPGALPDPH